MPAPSAAVMTKAAGAPVADAGALAEAVTTRRVSSTKALATRIEALRKPGLSGVRTLMVGASGAAALAKEAASVCRELAGQGLTTIIVDWSPAGTGVAESLGQPSWPGFSELLSGKSRFEDVVLSLRDSDVHIIPSGRPMTGEADVLDSDSINFLLDALDDVYDHIVVVSEVDPGKGLFEAMQGRFDCGVVLTGGKAPGQAAKPGTFLGFEVDGIELFDLETRPAASSVRQRFARAS